ncbi:MAG TPA: ABC transporter permease, partial [Solirubrobacteraceae bacterium]|nr:ABC transporter permease [Solirubrobacteraceae bacterium]
MTPEPPPRARLSLRDLFAEAGAGLMARPARVGLTVLGTVVGVAALVATLGLSKTAGSQIVGRFSTVAATDVVITPVPGTLGGSRAATAIPWDAQERLERLNGVAAAGTLSEVDVRGELVRTVAINDPLAQPDVQLPVRAASDGLWRAVRADLSSGRLPDIGHSQRGDRTAVLGRNAARRLGIRNLDQQPSIFIGERLYQVSGIVDSV